MLILYGDDDVFAAVVVYSDVVYVQLVVFCIYMNPGTRFCGNSCAEHFGVVVVFVDGYLGVLSIGSHE